MKSPITLPQLCAYGLAIVTIIYFAGCSNCSVAPPCGTLTKVYSSKSYNYLVYLPKEYNNDLQYKWPLILYLHGGNPRGSDLDQLKVYGIPQLIEEKKDFPFVIIAPQCPAGKLWWTDDRFEPLLDEIHKKYRIDPDRMYLTGSSMGGTGTIFLAVKYPETFAAIAPLCGRIRHVQLHRKARQIKHIPTWIFHGALDRTVLLMESETMVSSLKKYGADVKFTVFPDKGHSPFTYEVYNRDFLYQWFLEHKRSLYYKNGQKKFVGGYKNGNKHGKWIYWYKNGNKEREEEYKNGKAHGKWKYWHLNGKISGEAEFTEGTGKRANWYKNGNKERIEEFKNGKKHAKWVYWYENGEIEREIEYQDGMEHGTWKVWYPNGQKEAEYEFLHNKPHGKCTEWYISGKKKGEGIFENGNGEWIGWDEQGNKRYRQEYKDDKPHGRWIFWNRGGKVVIEEIYENGKLVKKKLLN
jgi:antitoxin component YwqK of YwqJK toxin-antitoxin module/predicted esterase